VINHSLPSDVVGTVLKSKAWWKPAMGGVVIMKMVVDSYVVALIGSDTLAVGGRLGTTHSIKFTVREKVPLAEMLTIMETSTGKGFKPNMLVSTNNITRGIGVAICASEYSRGITDSDSESESWSICNRSQCFRRYCLAKTGEMPIQNVPLN
jgi:hypothetical protein